MPQEHERALGAWQAEMAECSQLFVAAQAAVHAMAGVLPGLQVDTQRMAYNIAQVARSQTGATSARWFDTALAVQAGLQARSYRQVLQAELDC
jgi:3-carboxy-cis,cis-muconate cycloisomerase